MSLSTFKPNKSTSTYTIASVSQSRPWSSQLNGMNVKGMSGIAGMVGSMNSGVSDKIEINDMKSVVATNDGSLMEHQHVFEHQHVQGHVQRGGQRVKGAEFWVLVCEHVRKVVCVAMYACTNVEDAGSIGDAAVEAGGPQ